MARVLFYTGACLLALSAALLYLPTYFSFIIAVILFILLITLIIFHKKLVFKGLKTLLCIVLIFTIFGIYTNEFKIKPAEKLVGYKAEIVGTVTEFPAEYENYTVYIIETEKITLIQENGKPVAENIPQKLKLRLSDINSIGADVFDKLQLEVLFNDLDIYRNTSLANKIYAGGYVEALVANLGENRPFYAVFYDLREAISDLIYRNINFDDATVVTAVLLGDKEYLDPDFEKDSKVAGITHMLVVSGMHLGIIFQLLSKLFSALKLWRGTAEILMLGAIFSMTAICGFTPSILRAALTYVIIVLGNLIFRKPDSLNSLGAATIILLFINPLGFGNLSLLLSLLSTFGILFICPFLEENILSLISKAYSPGKITKAITFSVSQTLSATLATMPVCILGIGYISLISPLTNLLTGYASTLLTVFAFISVILLCLPSFLKAAAFTPALILCALVRYIVKVTDICADIDFASVPALNEYLISLGLFILIIPILILAKKFNTKKAVRIFLKLTASTLVIFSVSSAFFFYNASPKCEIAIPDVGRGTSVIIKTNTDVLAIGTGDALTDYNKIESHMFKMCSQSIDHIIIPTANKSFAAGAPEMIFQNPHAKVVYPNRGEYIDKLNYISNNNFISFDYKISFKLESAEVITFADIGTVVNFNNLSLIVYTGKGDLNSLFKVCSHTKPVLICADNLTQQIEYEVSQCIISGSDKARSNLEQALKKQNIDFRAVSPKTISIKF